MMNDYSHITAEYEILKRNLNFKFDSEKCKRAGLKEKPKEEDFELLQIRRVYHANRENSDHVTLTVMEPLYWLVNKGENRMLKNIESGVSETVGRKQLEDSAKYNCQCLLEERPCTECEANLICIEKELLSEGALKDVTNERPSRPHSTLSTSSSEETIFNYDFNLHISEDDERSSSPSNDQEASSAKTCEKFNTPSEATAATAPDVEASQDEEDEVAFVDTAQEVIDLDEVAESHLQQSVELLTREIKQEIFDEHQVTDAEDLLELLNQDPTVRNAEMCISRDIKREIIEDEATCTRIETLLENVSVGGNRGSSEDRNEITVGEEKEACESDSTVFTVRAEENVDNSEVVQHQCDSTAAIETNTRPESYPPATPSAAIEESSRKDPLVKEHQITNHNSTGEEDLPATPSAAIEENDVQQESSRKDPVVNTDREGLQTDHTKTFTEDMLDSISKAYHQNLVPQMDYEQSEFLDDFEMCETKDVQNTTPLRREEKLKKVHTQDFVGVQCSSHNHSFRRDEKPRKCYFNKKRHLKNLHNCPQVTDRSPKHSATESPANSSNEAADDQILRPTLDDHLYYSNSTRVRTRSRNYGKCSDKADAKGEDPNKFGLCLDEENNVIIDSIIFAVKGARIVPKANSVKKPGFNLGVIVSESEKLVQAKSSNSAQAKTVPYIIYQTNAVNSSVNNKSGKNVVVVSSSAAESSNPATTKESCLKKTGVIKFVRSYRAVPKFKCKPTIIWPAVKEPPAASSFETTAGSRIAATNRKLLSTLQRAPSNGPLKVPKKTFKLKPANLPATDANKPKVNPKGFRGFSTVEQRDDVVYNAADIMDICQRKLESSIKSEIDVKEEPGVDQEMKCESEDPTLDARPSSSSSTCDQKGGPFLIKKLQPKFDNKSYSIVKKKEKTPYQNKCRDYVATEPVHSVTYINAQNDVSSSVSKADEAKTYKCTMCSFKTFTESFFKTHLQFHNLQVVDSLQTTLRCTLCNFGTCTAAIMVNHVMVKHTWINSVKVFSLPDKKISCVCTECGFWGSNWNIATHYIHHHPLLKQK